MSNYNVALFGPDAEGFLTVQQNGASTVVGGNPQGVLGGNDGTDRIRNIERLPVHRWDSCHRQERERDQQLVQRRSPIRTTGSFTRHTTTRFRSARPDQRDGSGGNAVDPAVAVVVGNTLHGSAAAISDYDGINAGPTTSGSMSTPHPAIGST